MFFPQNERAQTLPMTKFYHIQYDNFHMKHVINNYCFEEKVQTYKIFPEICEKLSKMRFSPKIECADHLNDKLYNIST